MDETEVFITEQELIVNQLHILNDILAHNYDGEGNPIENVIFDEVDHLPIRSKILQLIDKMR